MMPILVVDDSREDIALVTRVFQQCAIRNPLIPMSSGDACISYFEKPGARKEGALPCLVLLDLAMSPKSGIDVLKRLSTSMVTDTGDSVFVMLSGVSDYSIVREGYQLGAATFLTKPIGPDELMAMLKSVRGIALDRQVDGFSVVGTGQGRSLVRLAVANPRT